MTDHNFIAEINIIGINPFVFVPEYILQGIFDKAGKCKGFIPIKGTINGKPYKQTLVKCSGHWRLYINMIMLKDSPKRIGEKIEITVRFDPESREIQPPVNSVKVLNANPVAQAVFDGLPPSKKLEIVRYLANLKTEESLEMNIKRAIKMVLRQN